MADQQSAPFATTDFISVKMLLQARHSTGAEQEGTLPTRQNIRQQLLAVVHVALREGSCREIQIPPDRPD